MPGLNGSGSSGGGNFGGLFSGSGLGMSFAAALLGLFTLNWNSPEEDEPGEEDIDTSTNDGGNPEKHARERWRQRHKNELAELKRRREEAYYEFVKKAPTKAQGYMDNLTKKLDSAIDIDMEVSFPETEKRNGWENALDTAKNIGKDVWNVASGREIFGDIQIGRHHLFTAMSKEDVNNMPFAENVVGNTIWALLATFYNTIGQAANIGGNLLQEAWNILEALEDWSYNTFGINSQDLNAALVAMGLPGISAFGSGIALFAQYSKFWLGHKFYKLMKLMSIFRAAQKTANFASPEKLTSHFIKHGKRLGFQSADDYLIGARNVMRNGYKVEYFYKPANELRTGYVQFLGNAKNGAAKFAFVGTNNAGQITTFHIESGKSFWKMLNGLNIQVINPIK